ncbi:MAG TPA: bifunctional helix-turn-helix transcriptional regulator/GNAT family N-acetyltransferase [Steroidobacteraceae bacterium]
MLPSPAKEHVDAVRSFNRFYTRQIGVLNESLLDSAFTLTQARVLFELAQRPQTTAKEIGDALDLDAGYLSRILAGFAKRKLITRLRSNEDSRQVFISLTPLGRKIFKQLDTSSHRATAQMLANLRDSDRQRLLACLNEVRNTLEPKEQSSGEIVLRGPRPGDIGWAIERHGALYAQEYGWNIEFDALVATLFANFATKHDPSCERMWIAELDGERVGCVFVVRNAEDPTAAQLRCLLVDPKARGKGVGRRLVQECISFAKAAGYKKMVLWTNDILVSARKIYEAEGFRLVSENRHQSFGKDLVGQIWEREL